VGSKNMINDEVKEKIIALLATGESKNAVARKLGVSWATVDKYGKEMGDELERLREQKKEQFIEQIWEDMESALELGRQKINLATVATKEFRPTIEKLVKLLEEKKDTKSKDIIELIKALSGITGIPLAHISTYFGTLYDKQALMSGDPTSRDEGRLQIEFVDPQ
jgi:transposase-like protein